MKSETSLMFDVCETFISISGESGWQGMVTTFIRFCGCDVECAWCDTLYARQESGTPCTQDDIVSICRANQVRKIILTGGEPMLQEGLPSLCECLLAEGFEVQVETSGTRLVSILPKEVMKVVDIKPPSAQAKKGFHWGNLDCLGEKDEIKLVLAERADYDWALNIMRKTGLDKRKNVLMSPVMGLLEPAELAEWITQDRLNCRLQLQLHKILWPEVNRGK